MNKLTTYVMQGTLVILLLTMIMTACSRQEVAVREKISFNKDWRFAQDDSAAYQKTQYNDANWRMLNLPHDWSIEGEFNPDHPAGVGGGALPGGVGWYRKSFTLPQSDSSRRVYITFDGVYRNSEVYINGQLLGKRPNGYITFQYDLTPHLNFGDQKNTLAVRVDNSDQPNSRWYTGSGIYRNVWLEKTHPIHVNLWGTHITTPTVTEQNAEVAIAIQIKNTTGNNEKLDVETHVLDPKNKTVAKSSGSVEVDPNSTKELRQMIEVNSPDLWSIDNPYLYKAVSYVKLNNKTIDVYETIFGIRSFAYDSKKGFSLNGEPTKIKGVCLHHDLGALGSALNKRARERQLEILKEMGCNGIRTAHNPPSPELLQLCDEMGFIVMNETFDMWKKKKSENDYSQYWEEWYEQDLTDHLLRDRNHPSVFSWSIGNEILEQWDSTGMQIARELTEIVKDYAPNIPVTSGLNDPEPHNNIIQSESLDLIGYNYHHESFEEFPEKFPGKKFIATETTSSLHTRGSYDMPSDTIRRWPKSWDEPFHDGNPDNTCSAYDNISTPWGSTHQESWSLIKKHDYLSGMYIWTGFDYLGEPTPYEWPSRSSYFGIVDLAGFPKDAYYMYQSEWTDKDVLHVFPHWNWEEGKTIDVWAYTNYDEVELFINGESQGVKTKEADDFHMMWRVEYEPGQVKAIGKRDNGDTKEVVINTAGEPARIKLQADRETINADGNDLSFVTVSVLDKEGNPVPHADNLIHFKISDNISIAGVDNGLQTSHEPFKADQRKAFHGKCLVILQSKEKKGLASLEAASEGLESSSLNITIQ